MSDWEFRDPWFLACALLAPLAARWAVRPRGRVDFSSLELLDGLPRSWRDALCWIPAALVALSVLSLSVALARPRSPMAETRIRGEGIALMLVVDCSGSMDARDLVPTDVQQNRLAVVRSVLQEFLMGPDGKHPQRPQDLIGAVAFAAFADGVCPLTLDHANLAQLIQELELASPDEDGTAIGDGLGLAVLRLRTSPVASKVIILLTDGENNTGALEPMPAARLAQESKIRVHCIGAGSRGVAPIPVRDPYGRVALRMARVTIDEECLKRIAQATGGRYFRATDANSLSEIYSEIDRLERTEISEIRYLQYDEHFSDWTLAGLGLFLAGLASEIIWFRSLP